MWFTRKRACSLPMVKRIFASILLWVTFGLLCAFLASKWDPNIASNPNYWGSALMWNIIWNRLMIGVMIAFAGFITFHPLLKIRMYPCLRGTVIGALVSLDISFGPFISGMENAWTVLAATVIAGAVYGMIIDYVATRYGWEGKALLEGTQK